MKRIITVLFLILFSSHSYAFGKNGHRIVAQIAQQLLTPQAKQAILKITHGFPLAKIATFPDDIHPDPAWVYTRNWHFANVNSVNDLMAIKPNKEPHNIIQALPDVESQLMHRKTLSPQKQWQALSFYVHLIGDLHQPLHLGYLKDRGGNFDKVMFFSKQTNLHSVWDSGIINAQQLSYTEYSNFLKPNAAQIKKWSHGTYLDWAKESVNYCKVAYNSLPSVTDGNYDLSYNYMYKTLPLINQRLQQAGVRLAFELNRIFG